MKTITCRALQIIAWTLVVSSVAFLCTRLWAHRGASAQVAGPRFTERRAASLRQQHRPHYATLRRLQPVEIRPARQVARVEDYFVRTPMNEGRLGLTLS